MSFTLQTPPRPLPGAYFQTPAAKHSSPASRFAATRSPFAAPSPAGQGLAVQGISQPSGAQQALSLPAPSTASRDLQHAQRAAQTVNDTLIQEARFPLLEDYLSCEYDET